MSARHWTIPIPGGAISGMASCHNEAVDSNFNQIDCCSCSFCCCFWLSIVIWVSKMVTNKTHKQLSVDIVVLEYNTEHLIVNHLSHGTILSFLIMNLLEMWM